MKKKAIEKIPFAPAQSNTVVSFLQTIKGEEHLFVEVTAETAPWIRMVFTKTDWGLFYPASNTWSAAGLDEEKHKFRNAIITPESETIIKNFCSVKYATWIHPTWVQSLTDLIQNIRLARMKKRDTVKKARLEERKRNTPSLPGDLKNWINENLLAEHFLYYKRHGRYADIACSKCCHVTTVCIKANDYDWYCEKTITPPKHGERGICPHCKIIGTYKAKGKTKGVYALGKRCFVGQAYKEQGVVIRYLEVEKVYRLDVVVEDGREVMDSAQEKVIVTEIARTYLEPNKKPQTDYHKFSSYSGDYWDDCNLSGMNKISIPAARVYPGSYRELKNTFLKYSAAEQYAVRNAVYNLKDYMIQYVNLPQLEMLVKMGLYGVAEAILRFDYSNIRRYAKKVEDFLGIRKERIKDLMSVQGRISYLKAWQFEKEQGIRLTYKAAIFMAESKVRTADMRMILQYTTITKLIHKIEGYVGVKVPETIGDILCAVASARLIQITTFFMDYINMRLQRGYDLHNQIFLFPRDLWAAHDQMILETTQRKIEDRSKEVEEKYPHIKEKYRALRKSYFYEDEEYQIRPARSASEIVAEGQILHHCVGGDNYLRKHDEGESTILFMRPKENLEMPYVTIEIKEDKIVQWYGIRDTKPNEIIIDDHLRKYIASMKEEHNGISAVKHG